MINNCQQPPVDLPAEWSDYIHPNCFQNIERLGKWIGGTTTVGHEESPENYFAEVPRNSVGANGKGTNLYVLTHGWAPGLRKAVDRAAGRLKWWSAEAIRSDKPVWGSNWAWTATQGEKLGLEVSPTGLLQQIEKYEAQSRNGKEAYVMAYSWIDDSGTLPIEFSDPDTWLDAHRSEAYTNLNGLRMAAAIMDATAHGFFENPNNKIHIIGHSHGTKVATIACLNLQSKGVQVEQLTILDPAENWMCLKTNIANLLGYYFEKMKIAKPDQIGLSGFTFVENYVSFFGQGLAGPEGSTINNIKQVGLESGHVFKIDDISARHAYAAIWYSNAQAAAKTLGGPGIGLAWPPVTPNPNVDYFQKFHNSKTSWNREQWILNEGNISGAGAKTIEITNQSVNITEISTAGEVSGSASDELVFSFKNGLAAIPASYVGSFEVSKNVKGISFDLKWSNPRPNEYIVITVESPLELLNPKKQQIAVVLDASAFKNTGNIGIWHPMSFNSYAALRSKTRFEIHYFPGKTWKGQYGSVSIKNFGGVREVEVG